MNFQLRAKALNFYLECCLDVDPFLKLQVPSGLAVFKDLIELDMETIELLNLINLKTLTFEIKVAKVKIPNRIL